MLLARYVPVGNGSHDAIHMFAISNAFVDYFTAALQYEYSGKGVIIQVGIM